MNNRLTSKITSIPPALWILVILCLFFSITIPDKFLKGNTLSSIFIQASPLIVLALGQTFIVIMQGTDLSVASMVGMISVIWVASAKAGVPMGLSIVIMILVGIIAGLANGLIVSKLDLPTFIATLGTASIFKTLALLVSKKSTIYYKHPIFTAVGNGKLLGISYLTIITVIVFVFTWLLLFKTRFGIKIFAMGGNSEALLLMGVDTKKFTILAFGFMGFIASISAFMVTARLGSGSANMVNNWEFNSIAAVLLGGSSLRDGYGSVTGTVFGVLLIQTLRVGLNLIQTPAIYHNAILGIVVLLALIVDALIKSSKESKEM